MNVYTGLEASLGQFLKFGGVVVLATQASCALALMVASFSANALLTLALRKWQSARTRLGWRRLSISTTAHNSTNSQLRTVPAFITPMVLFSGFLYDTAALPPYLAWLPKVSIVNYGFSAMVREWGLGSGVWMWHQSRHHTLVSPNPNPQIHKHKHKNR